MKRYEKGVMTRDSAADCVEDVRARVLLRMRWRDARARESGGSVREGGGERLMRDDHGEEKLHSMCRS
jgi:hypothetical protein